ncbi:MAG: hypothetical protein AAB316_14665 [Bacteroidota bacterium]
MSKSKKNSTDFDHPWKLIFTYFFQEAIAFIEPLLYALIDWNRGVEFLEQELHEIIKIRFRGAKLCDKLAKVWLKNGEELFLLAHVEIEMNPKAIFGLRFFWYRVLILDKHKTENIYSLAIYPGPPSSNQVSQYEFKLLTNRVLFEFPAFKIWEQDEATLIASENIFALFVLAQQYANKTKNDAERRLHFREKLFDLAYEKNIPKRRIWEALIFVKHLTILPENLEIEYKKFSERRLKLKSQSPMKLEDVKWMDDLLEATTGQSLQKMLSQAQREAKHAQDEAKHAQLQLNQAVVKCYRERKWSVDEIAEFFNLEKVEVERMLKKAVNP